MAIGEWWGISVHTEIIHFVLRELDSEKRVQRLLGLNEIAWLVNPSKIIKAPPHFVFEVAKSQWHRSNFLVFC
jgi:hypothetical protein